MDSKIAIVMMTINTSVILHIYLFFKGAAKIYLFNINCSHGPIRLTVILTVHCMSLELFEIGDPKGFAVNSIG